MSYDIWSKEETQLLVKKAFEFAKKFRAGEIKTPLKILAKDLGRSYKSVSEKIFRLKKKGISFPSLHEDGLQSLELSEILASERDKAIDKGKEKALRSLLVEGSTQFHFLETLREIIPRYEYKPPLRPEKRKRDLDEEDFVILISDIHGGMLIDKKETGGIGEYNMNIFNQRYNQFKTAIEKIIRIEGRNRPIRRIWLFYLGDIVEGHDIFTGQPYHLDMNAAESSLYLAKTLSEFEIFLSYLVPEVQTVEVVGNHGVPGGRKAGALPLKLSFDWIFYEVKKMMTEKYPNIIHKIAESWFQLVNVRGHHFLLSHGEDIRSTLRIPYYGIDRAYGNYMDLLKVPFAYFVLAHFHAAASLPGSGYSEKIINGCWPGGGGLTKKIQVASLPEQWMFGVHEKQGITFRYKIKLMKDIKFPELDIYSAKG